MEEFRVPSGFATVLKAAPWCTLGGAALVLLIPVVPVGSGSDLGDLLLSGFLSAVFVFLTVVSFQALKRLPSMDKAADADGVWCLGWPKEQTLLRWDEIASLKARPQLQRLDVLDGYGRTRLNVDYQLLGFERLRTMLHERLIAASQPDTGQRYSKGVSHHLFYLGAVLALPFFGMLPGACGVEETPFIAHVFAAGMSAWCVYEYARTPLGVRVGEASVTLFYPLRRRTIPFADVTGIEVADTFHERKRFTKVLIRTLDRSKGFRVPRMGVGTSTLYIELRRAWQAQPA